jgi:hypothetical protein
LQRLNHYYEKNDFAERNERGHNGVRQPTGVYKPVFHVPISLCLDGLQKNSLEAVQHPGEELQVLGFCFSNRVAARFHHLTQQGAQQMEAVCASPPAHCAYNSLLVLNSYFLIKRRNDLGQELGF